MCIYLCKSRLITLISKNLFSEANSITLLFCFDIIQCDECACHVSTVRWNQTLWAFILLFRTVTLGQITVKYNNEKDTNIYPFGNICGYHTTIQNYTTFFSFKRALAIHAYGKICKRCGYLSKMPAGFVCLFVFNTKFFPS